MREFEADLLWGYHGETPSTTVRHARLGFYKGDLFTEEPTIQRDVMPMLQIMKEEKPHIVTVALDPEGSGPDTHYKVLQTVSTACKVYRSVTGEENVEVWGYRNVWFRFAPAEATLFIPVSPSEHANLCDSFECCFLTQRNASFPSPMYDGPFSDLARKLQVGRALPCCS